MGSKSPFVTWVCSNTSGNSSPRTIEGPSTLVNLNIVRPTWCPIRLKSLDVKSQTQQASSTSGSKYSMWDNMPRMIQWEDVKEQKVYHVPPTPYNSRMDILVTSKFPAVMHYKVLSKDGKKMPYMLIDSAYPNSIISKRMVEDKIIKVVNV